MLVIVKSWSSPICIALPSVHCIFDGSIKQAKKYCDNLNRKATTYFYEPKKVKIVRGEG